MPPSPLTGTIQRPVDFTLTASYSDSTVDATEEHLDALGLTHAHTRLIEIDQRLRHFLFSVLDIADHDDLSAEGKFLFELVSSALGYSDGSAVNPNPEAPDGPWGDKLSIVENLRVTLARPVDERRYPAGWHFHQSVVGES